ncbi:MAG TPA: endo-1,4-beta-xylanase [Candidatus Dormibacteraeota bacterium]|nr:endo-1,4-beta-xylanase [Candidatus Dormibacteraeota bacterium]
MVDSPVHRDHRAGRWLLAAGAVGLLLIGLAASLRPHPAAAADPLRALATAKGLQMGTAVQASALANDAKYSAGVSREFNSVTPENEMKWDATEPSQGQFNFGNADAIVNFATANNETVRGHNLVWHSQLPSWVTNSGFTAAQVKQVMLNHIAGVAGHFKGKVISWDVVNEPFNEDGSFRSDVFSQAMGTTGTTGYIATALTAAHQADPAAKLYLNDFNIEGVNTKSTAMLNLMTSLKQAGVPIDGVGLESHFIEGGNPSIQSNIQRFVNAGFSVWITELDDRFTSLPPSTAGLDQQATEYANVVKACLAVTGCVGITVWEYTDKYSWVPGAFSGQGAADIFDQNIDPKPAYTAMVNAFGGTVTSPTPTPTATPTATPTPTPTSTPTPTPTPTATPTPTPTTSAGSVTATSVVASSSPWFIEEDVRLNNTGTVTALTVTIVVQRTNGVSFNGQYNTVGGQILQSNSSTASTVTYTFTLASGQTLTAGTGRIFAGQLSGTGTQHSTTADTFTVTATSGGTTSTLSGHF